ncbi:methyltransferase [bacterium]|nr:methyltransferase [bacterium]
MQDSATWTFNGEIVGHFDEHIERSVPLYAQGHQLVLAISDYFIGPESWVIDLGCSTGQLTQYLAQRAAKKSGRVLAVDSIPAMIAKAQERCIEHANIDWACEDLLAIDWPHADFIVAYYTLQFIPPKCRQVVLDRIYDRLNWGGAFVCFEKVRAPDARFQDIMTGLYTDYKLEQGYSSDAILKKARQLKQVLAPFSTQGNRELLARAGFVDTMTVFKHVCFEGVLAIK